MNELVYAPTYRGVVDVANWQWRLAERSESGMRASYFLDAAKNYLIAASLARNKYEEAIALQLSWFARERARGRISVMETSQ